MPSYENGPEWNNQTEVPNNNAGGLDAGTGAMLQAGGSMLGAIGNLLFGSGANKKNREFQEHMYNRQRADALADWDRQNAYNSPQEQMRRLKAAGLNPNLIYGNGAVANNASGVQGGTPSRNFTYQPLQVDPNMIGDSVNQYFNVMKQKQEIDNLKKQNELLQTTDLLRFAQYINESQHKPDTYDAKAYKDWQEAYNKGQEFNFKNLTWATDLKIRETQLQKMIGEIALNKSRQVFTDSENIRQEKSLPVNLALNAQRTLLARAQTAQSYKEQEKIGVAMDLMKSQAVRNDMEILANLSGYSMKDNIVLRQISEQGNRFLSILIPGFEKMGQERKAEMIKKLNKDIQF